MAKPMLVANWKNHPASLFEAKTLSKHLRRDAGLYKRLSLFIAPPLPYLDQVSQSCGNFSRIASQDIPSQTIGTHTGMVTPDILKSFGVALSIIGHSERRALGETDDEVRTKVKVALATGIMPLVCVGEKSRDQEGEHFEFLRDQLKHSLEGIGRAANVSKLAIAYEPVWAIGKRANDAMRPADLSQSVLFLKKVLTDMFGRLAAERIPILYGGSVEQSNAAQLISETGIKGFLVGHASLDAPSFKAIAESLI